jgi:serine/threonine-protein kinase
MSSAGDIGVQGEPIACPKCGSASRVGRGLCLSCLLYRGLGEETFDSETLESVLQEVDVPDAEWRLGNYQILEEIGRGGMGVIYRARQRHSRRIVALKRILAHHAESHDTLVRFRREAEAAASLDHANILPIYEVSEGEDGLPFFSMKFAVGGSLVGNRATLNVEIRRAVGLTAKVARAVEYAHSRGILHRDLKPGNILLDGRGEPLVCDFGLAKWLDESSDLTRTLTIFGTPGYIAPEQAHGPAANLKPTADIYSLGAVLFDLLAGRPPFLGEHALSVIHQAAEKPAPRLRSIVREIDRDLETVCARCLERDPNARYQSAGDLAEDLERWVGGKPIVARPVLPPTRVWRWAKRSPKLAASVGGCILGAFAIATFVTLTVGPNARLRPVPRLSEKSVAVLPFQNLSDDKQNAYFTDGVQDEILNDLAKVADLKVISRTSVMQYGTQKPRNLREIANALGVAHIVEGTVQRIGDHVRVSAQLIDARTDMHLWGEHYDRQLEDVFAIESDLAQQIVAKLKSKLSPSEKAAIEEKPTHDLAAYDLYSRAKSLIERGVFTEPQKNLYQAVDLLQQAIQRDPSFALAYYQLAHAHDQIFQHHFDHTAARLALADGAIQMLRRLRPGSAESHFAMAKHLYWGYGNYDAARNEIDAALRELPNDPTAYLLIGYLDRRQAHWDDSIRNMERAVELDPQNSFVLQQIALSYDMLRRYSDAAATLDRAIAISGHDPQLHLQRAEIDLDWRADPNPLRSAVDRIISDDSDAATRFTDYWFIAAWWQRDLAAADTALKHGAPGTLIQWGSASLPYSWCRGIVARQRGDTAGAQTAFMQAHAETETILRNQPDDVDVIATLGLINAALGNKKAALRAARHVLAVIPVSKDVVARPAAMESVALIYAWTGKIDDAIAEVNEIVKMPGYLSYGKLKSDPLWDPLRNDPRFQKLLTSLAPK